MWSVVSGTKTLKNNRTKITMPTMYTERRWKKDMAPSVAKDVTVGAS